jgi:hypothetical protein
MEIRNYITTDLKPLTAKTIGMLKIFFWGSKLIPFPVVEEGVYITVLFDDVMTTTKK